jgi:protein-disulfide isomerase
MFRISWIMLIAALLIGSDNDRACGAEPTGKWKLTLPGQGTLWLLKFESKDGRLTGSVVDYARQRVPPTTIEDVRLDGDRLRFTLKLQGQSFRFDGRVPKAEAKKILGCLELGRRLVVTHLDATKMADLDDAFEAGKEMLTTDPQNPELFDTVVGLLRQATSKHATPPEVRGWADKLYKAAEPYGERWQRDVGLRIAAALADQQSLAPVAVEYARRAERLLDPTDDPNAQIRVLEVLALTLRKTDKESEAKEIDARIEKLEAKADAEYLKTMPPFETTRFTGTRRSERPVLVELFTGAQCPPCVAADVAFDALEKTYKPADVVLLQYHLNIPGPDALTNADTEARQQYYGEEVGGTPTIFFNGKPGAGGGGPMSAGKAKYGEYRDIIRPLLDASATAPKLQAHATRKGDKLEILAEVSDLEQPSEKIRLRLALVEEQVRYVGGNGLRFHHRVVRAFPGGADGLPLTEKAAKHAVTLDLAELRKTVSERQEKPGARQASRRPMDLNKLRLVAFIQNDDSKQVLQSTEVGITADR